jgi:hypothetical protein
MPSMVLAFAGDSTINRFFAIITFYILSIKLFGVKGLHLVPG